MNLKTRFPSLALIIIINLCAIGVLIFPMNSQVKAFAAIVLFSSFAGFGTQVFTGYIILTQRLFKIRYLFNGIANGIFIALLFFINEMGKNSGLKWNDFAVMLIIGQVVAIPLFYIISLISFNILYEKTKLERISGEIVLMSDRAYYIDNEQFIAGRLILTNQRLCFRSKKSDYSQYDFILSESKPEFEEVKYFGIPGGFSIKGKNMKVKVNFPLFWEKEILKLIPLLIIF